MGLLGERRLGPGSEGTVTRAKGGASDAGGRSYRRVIALVKTLRGIRRATSVSLAIAVLLSAAGCGLNPSTICEGAGGTYVGGTCSRWGPRQQAEEQMCESSGGVYLRGEESCAVGEGGP
jgi:hypothetical protein